MAEDASIVITGMGVVSPLGRTTDGFWQALLKGTVATGQLTRFDTSVLSVETGAEVSEGDEVDTCPSLALKWAVEVAETATEDASLSAAGIDPARVGVSFGSVMGTRSSLDLALLKTEPEKPSASPWGSPSLLSREPARRLGLAGPNCSIATACAAGNSAVAYGAEALRRGRADAMVVGGVDEISQTTLLIFDSFRALADDFVRPFDAGRRGLMLGEGAAALVLEREEDAKARGATIRGRVLGYANVCDAHHITAPHPEGRGAIRSMRRAMEMAGLQPSDVDHVNAHGTGTRANDSVEAGALRRVFGQQADRLPVTALKSMLGHAQGGASALEAVACVLSMRDGLIPPTANHVERDPECDLDVVTGTPRKSRIRVALSNAFGFGGNIECLLLGAP